MNNDKRLLFADKITLERIKKMHPKLRDSLLDEYLTINYNLPKGVRLRFTQTLRTIAEQNELYAQGRTKKGKIVTQAIGGKSYHNYGLSFDIVILYDKDLNGSFESAEWTENKYWKQVVEFFKFKGWKWGGEFRSFKDSPHFEKTFGVSISQCQARLKSGDVGMVDGIEYINI